jgi:hypothetical protein
MSSAAPPGGRRFVLDENGRRVRNVNFVDGGAGGSESGERRVRDNDGRGGRGVGRGGGGSDGGGGGKMNPRLVNASITSAVSPQDILAVVRDNLLALNHVNVSTAFNRLGKMGSRRDLSPRHLTADKGFQELLDLVRGFVEKQQFDPQHVANTTHGIAKLHEAGRLDAADGNVDDALAALETDTIRVAPTMKPQEVSNTVWAYAVLKRMPDDKTWTALETTAGRVAREMNPQNVANTMWAFSKMERMPDDKTWAALETAAGRVAREMNPQEVANTMWTYAKLERMPNDNTWAALETAAGRVAREMNPQALANTMWTYAKLERMPGDKTWAALETAAGRVAREMNPQEVANTMWTYAKLERMPDDKTWAALETAAGRVVLVMNSQELVTALWASATLFTLRDVEHPPCYAAMWVLVCGLNASDFSDESLRMLFHVHLMHHFSSSGGSVKVAYPAWLMVDARDAWMRNVQDDTTVSRSHQALASVIGELGIRHEVERVTGDGYFSMDIYLPEYDVAVEFDGPTHYYHSSASSSSRDASKMLRTAKTELRDCLLAKQCAKVVTVPWFEWRDTGSTPERRRAYVREKLAKEAGVKV